MQSLHGPHLMKEAPAAAQGTQAMMAASSITAGMASSKKQCLCKACRQRPVLTHISTRRPLTYQCRMGRTRHQMRPQRSMSSPRSTTGARRPQCWSTMRMLLPIRPALTHRQTALLRALKGTTTAFSRHLQQEHMQRKCDDSMRSGSEKGQHLSLLPSALQQAVELSASTWCH